MTDPEKQPSSKEAETVGLHEAIRHANTVTLEFGTGDSPLFTTSARTFDEDNLYIGVNIDPKQQECLADKVGAVHGFSVLSELKEGAIAELPVPDESVDMVYMANVFGEPDSEFIMDRFKGEDGRYKGNSDIEAKAKTLKEASRVLKPGGCIVILENNTPYTTRGVGVDAHSAAIALVEASGLSVVDALDQKSEDWEKVVSQFVKRIDWWWSFQSYLIIAAKAGSTSREL